MGSARRSTGAAKKAPAAKKKAKKAAAAAPEPAKRTIRPEAVRQRAFLSAFGQLGNVTDAARAARVARQQHYRWLEDAEYAAGFQEAQVEACERLESEARRRAITGTLRPVFYMGSECGRIREYSDTLLIFLMKGAMPQKYRDNVKIEHSGQVNLVERLAAGRARLAKDRDEASSGG